MYRTVYNKELAAVYSYVCIRSYLCSSYNVTGTILAMLKYLPNFYLYVLHAPYYTCIILQYEQYYYQDFNALMLY